MNYVSICSGIEAATAAWHPLGWSPLAFSEIEPFPSAVLAHHHPDVPNLGDMTKYEEWKFCGCDRVRMAVGVGDEPIEALPHNDQKPDGSRDDLATKKPNCETCGHPIIDLLVGGTPCQSFSVAGLRKGLADPRGNLTLTFLAMVDRFRPSWVVWENVPGVLSDRTNAFGQFLAGLGELRYQYAWRVLDAQHFGVPQRRRRVFVVASIGGVHPGEVLFEPESLCRDLTPSRGEGEVAPTIPSRSTGGGGLGTDFDCDGGLIPNVVGALCKNDHGGLTGQEAANGHVKVGSGGQSGNPPAVAFTQTQRDEVREMEVVGALAAEPGAKQQTYLRQSTAVRRLTPVECERLQGFPDDHTRIPWRGKPADQCPDGPRYKALGNSMAVPVMAWIGERIQKFSGA